MFIGCYRRRDGAPECHLHLFCTLTHHNCMGSASTRSDCRRSIVDGGWKASHQHSRDEDVSVGFRIPLREAHRRGSNSHE